MASQLTTVIRDLIPHAMRERLRRFITGRGIPRYTYNQDGLASAHNCDFIRNKRFHDAYAAGKKTGSWGGADIHWRAHVVCWAANKGMSVEGDFVECGVNKGGLASAVLNYTELFRTTRKFWLLDTYNGLVERCLSPAERSLGKRPGGYEECYDAVIRSFADYPNVVIVRGVVPDTLKEVTANAIAFLSIDMNCMEPEIAAAECFWPRLSRGAVMVLDDYGWDGHIEQKLAFDRFAADRGVEVLCLPTGQGLIIKP